MLIYFLVEIKFCLLFFFIRGRFNFMFRGEVGDFCVEG